jgi:hypothetical protein
VEEYEKIKVSRKNLGLFPGPGIIKKVTGNNGRCCCSAEECSKIKETRVCSPAQRLYF